MKHAREESAQHMPTILRVRRRRSSRTSRTSFRICRTGDDDDSRDDSGDACCRRPAFDDDRRTDTENLTAPADPLRVVRRHAPASRCGDQTAADRGDPAARCRLGAGDRLESSRRMRVSSCGVGDIDRLLTEHASDNRIQMPRHRQPAICCRARDNYAPGAVPQHRCSCSHLRHR